ncbi:MAG: TIGR00159 family protein [Ruminococcaceae bacterium]|nr:TIGR00159 family protein [Oscillospiraceae bacterium]
MADHDGTRPDKRFVHSSSLSEGFLLLYHASAQKERGNCEQECINIPAIFTSLLWDFSFFAVLRPDRTKNSRRSGEIHEKGLKNARQYAIIDYSYHRGGVFVRPLLIAVPQQLTDLWDIVRRISFLDVLDILLVSVLLYYLFKFVRERRAGKLAMGVLLLIAANILVHVLDMYLLRFILQNIIQVGFITLVILFQPEIRSMLEKVGATPMKGFRSLGESRDLDAVHTMIGEVTQAVGDLSESKTGALIVFERTTKLGDLILTGTVIDAFPAAFLIKNIFYNKAPMHDGAMIIRNGRINAAGCLLPLSSNPDISKDLGTRHRAGLGMSENSDAVVVIVSEETGTISTAVEGKLTRDYSPDTLRTFLTGALLGDGGRKRFGFPNLGRERAGSPEKKTRPNAE